MREMGKILLKYFPKLTKTFPTLAWGEQWSSVSDWLGQTHSSSVPWRILVMDGENDDIADIVNCLVRAIDDIVNGLISAIIL